MSRMLNRSDPSFLHPGWTKEETSLLVELWRDLESNPKSRCPNRKGILGGLNKHIAGQLARRSSRNRSPQAVGQYRSKLYEAIRFVSTFDEMQQTFGGRLWFDLTKEERDQVELPVRGRRSSSALTRESFNTLVKLRSVRKWTKVRKAVLPKIKAPVVSADNRTSKCRSCWSAIELKLLVSTWSLAMSTSQTLVSTFVNQGYSESARLYSPWNRSKLSAWRKMKRIAESYLFIRAFNERHTLTGWFQLSDCAQNLQMDWSALPADFEDIGQDTFDEIHRMDSSVGSEPFTSVVSRSNPLQIEQTKGNFQQAGKAFSSLLNYRSGSAESVDSSDDDSAALMLRPARRNLRTQSPHIPYRNERKPQNGAKQTHDKHSECNALYEHMEQLQKKQFKQVIHRLKVDIERDIQVSADTVRAIFFERFGDPRQNGDAAFVVNLLEDQHRKVCDHFAQFQGKHF